MLNSYTGIYQAQDELKARRGLGFLTQELSRVAFLFKGGWFEIVTLDVIAEEAAANSMSCPMPSPIPTSSRNPSLHSDRKIYDSGFPHPFPGLADRRVVFTLSRRRTLAHSAG
jgi:hypothetical protein